MQALIYKWGLKINVNKTKICVFEKRKQVNNFVLKLNDEQIEVVDNFTYQCVNFTSTGNMKKSVKALSSYKLIKHIIQFCLFLIKSILTSK